MKNLLRSFVIVLLISACGTPSTAEPTIVAPPEDADPAVAMATPVCISSEPTDADVDRALTYTEDLFSDVAWERSYTVAGGRVSVTWSNSVDAAVAYLEALIFPCTYEEPDLNNFFSEQNWQIIFTNYESYKPVSECKTDDGLRLYQFSAVEQGFEYDIKYWAENDTETRVVGMMIVFPADSDALMDEYSEALFPDLASCQ